MNLIPYLVTALAQTDADGTDGSNIVAGAVIVLRDLTGVSVTMYDDVDGSNGNTSKLTDSKGQKVIWVEPAIYDLEINGGNISRINIPQENKALAVNYVDDFDGADFGVRLQSAIDAVPENSIIDCRGAVADLEGLVYVINATVNITKPVLIYLPASDIRYTGTYNKDIHMFAFGADNISIIGFGRSSRDTLKLNTTTLLMESGNGGYHFYSRGHNVIKISALDIIGVQTSTFESIQGDITNPIDGSGGIYLEKPDPDTTSSGNNVNQINLSDLYIEGTRAHGIYVDTPILCVFQNVRISRAGGHGFFLNGGTSSRFDNCYTSSAHKAGFCLAFHSYGALIACAAEFSGIGYWMRSCNAIALISTGAESNGNRRQFVPNTDITTTNANGDVVVISDIGSDNETNFWRGHGYVVTGGRNISLQNVYATNNGLISEYGTSSQTRGVLVRGNARSVEVRNPRITVSSSNTYTGRYDIAVEAFGADTPSNTDIMYDVTDGLLPANIAGEFITTVDSSINSCPILNEGVNTCVRYGATFVTPIITV